MDKPRIPPVIVQAHKLLDDAENTMRRQCALMNAAAGKTVIDEAHMVKHLDLFIRLVCLDLACADSKITEREADLLNAIFRQSWPAEQYAALQYDLKNQYQNLLSKDMGARLLACNITSARLLRETYDPDGDWLLKTVSALGQLIISSDRNITADEKAHMEANLRKIHDEAVALLSSLAPS